MSTILILFILVAIGGAIYYYLETQAARDVAASTMPASQVIRQAIQEIGAERRWTATGHSADFASFTFKRHANCGVAIILAFFFIIPAIIYMMIGSRTESLTVNVFPEPDSTSAVQISSSGRHARNRGKRFLRSLPGLRQASPKEAQALYESAPGGAALPPAEPPPQVAPTSEPAAPALQETSASASTPAQDAETVYCEHCGAKMLSTHRFCPTCGKEPSEA